MIRIRLAFGLSALIALGALAASAQEFPRFSQWCHQRPLPFLPARAERHSGREAPMSSVQLTTGEVPLSYATAGLPRPSRTLSGESTA
jgi:hypothetical protein